MKAACDAIRFTPDVLYATEREELIEIAQEQFAMLFDVIRLAKAAGSAPSSKATTIGKTTRATVFSPNKISATLHEVKDIFFSEHTQLATGSEQTQQIYSLLTPSTKHPMRSASVRWALWEAPSKMVRKRDVVYVEYMDSFVDENGRRGWARCTHSIEHRSCPSLANSHNVVRAFLYCSGSLYTETDEPGVLEVETLFDIDTRGIPAWMSKMMAMRKAQSASNVEHLIRLSRVMTDEDDPDVKLVEFEIKGKVCRGCGDRISKWSSSRKCCECKEHLCKNCSEVVYYNSDERKKMKNICVYCVDDVITDGEQRCDVFSGLDSINENSYSTRRMHHMSFRSLRMSRETNFSISPTSSELVSGFSSSNSSSSSLSRSQLLTQRAMFRSESDPGIIPRANSSNQVSSIRRSASILV
ncbi:hypothetical protein ATCC90586_005362 [Pythium insidiosum]|nr:hypothetical protein ATCC90586_005362 [Pythium insidiosum]